MVNRKYHHLETENPHHIMKHLFLISGKYQAVLLVSCSEAAQWSLVAFDIGINETGTLWYVLSIDPVTSPGVSPNCCVTRPVQLLTTAEGVPWWHAEHRVDCWSKGNYLQ